MIQKLYFSVENHTKYKVNTHIFFEVSELAHIHRNEWTHTRDASYKVWLESMIVVVYGPNVTEGDRECVLLGDK